MVQDEYIATGSLAIVRLQRTHPSRKGTMSQMEGPKERMLGGKAGRPFSLLLRKRAQPQRDNGESILPFCSEGTREGTSALVRLGFTLSSIGFLGHLWPAQGRRQWAPNLGPGSDHTDALRMGQFVTF